MTEGGTKLDGLIRRTNINYPDRRIFPPRLTTIAHHHRRHHHFTLTRAASRFHYVHLDFDRTLESYPSITRLGEDHSYLDRQDRILDLPMWLGQSPQVSLNTKEQVAFTYRNRGETP